LGYGVGAAGEDVGADECSVVDAFGGDFVGSEGFLQAIAGGRADYGALCRVIEGD
jgi:hypothetical protein